MEAEGCALAGTDYRPTPLRRRAGRPQLKRDPLGASRAPVMNRRFPLPLLLPLLLATAGACHTPPQLALAPSDSTVCYSLQFGSWTSWGPGAFATAPVGFQMPLPDTIGLSHAVARIWYGRPLYLVLTTPADSGHAGGFWIARGPDSVMVRFPSSYGWGLQLVLAVVGDRLQGHAGVFSEQASDQLTFNRGSSVTGVRVSCPDTLNPFRSGA